MSNETNSSFSFEGGSIKKVKVDYAIISAMPEETAFLLDYFSSCEQVDISISEANLDFDFKIFNYKNNKILIANSGIGTTFAAGMFTLIHSNFKPDYFFIIGTAGGIQDDIKIGKTLIVENVFEAELRFSLEMVRNTPFQSCLQHPMNKKEIPMMFSASEELLSIVNSLELSSDIAHRGAAVTSNSFPTPKELFDKIKLLQPYAIDMETSAFYQMAWLLNTNNVLAIRGVSNAIDSKGEDEEIDQADVSGSSMAAANILKQILEKSIQLNNKKNQDIKSMSPGVMQLVEKLKLMPHPEGGYFALNYKSTQMVQPCDAERYHNEPRSAGTSIYYLLDKQDFSTWHVLKSDEIWHYYKGSPLKIYTLDADGTLSTDILGDPIEVKDASFQIIIKADTYFAAENIDKDTFSLVGCTVSPGFEYKDFELINNMALSEKFPGYKEHKDIIDRLSRETQVVEETANFVMKI